MRKGEWRVERSVCGIKIGLIDLLIFFFFWGVEYGWFKEGKREEM